MAAPLSSPGQFTEADTEEAWAYPADLLIAAGGTEITTGLDISGDPREYDAEFTVRADWRAHTTDRGE